MKSVLFFILLAVMVCFSGCKEVNDNMTVADNTQSVERLPGISKPLR